MPEHIDQKTVEAQRKRTPEENLRAIMASSSYVLAEEDLEFLKRDELRPVRLQLELSKPELALKEHHIRSTIVVFGGTRVIEEAKARRRVETLEARAEANPDDETIARDLGIARRVLAKSRYYDEARELARIVSETMQEIGNRELVVITGGGPGIMEAANRGAFEAGAESIGLNITIEHEQEPNPFITPELCFQFHYFALRKMHFLKRARGLVAFPGGFGTMDEIFETLTLLQTKKIDPIPVILFGREFWEGVVNWERFVEEGTIAPDDLELFQYAETAREAWELICGFYGIDPDRPRRPLEA